MFLWFSFKQQVLWQVFKGRFTDDWWAGAPKRPRRCWWYGPSPGRGDTPKTDMDSNVWMGTPIRIYIYIYIYIHMIYIYMTIHLGAVSHRVQDQTQRKDICIILHLSIYPCIHAAINLSIYLSIYLTSIHPSIHPSLDLPGSMQHFFNCERFTIHPATLTSRARLMLSLLLFTIDGKLAWGHCSASTYPGIMQDRSYW